MRRAPHLPPFVRATLDVLPGANILVVDDSSPDGTGELADRLAASDGRIRFLHRASKQGPGTAYVQALQKGPREG